MPYTMTTFVSTAVASQGGTAEINDTDMLEVSYQVTIDGTTDGDLITVTLQSSNGSIGSFDLNNPGPGTFSDTALYQYSSFNGQLAVGTQGADQLGATAANDSNSNNAGATNYVYLLIDGTQPTGPQLIGGNIFTNLPNLRAGVLVRLFLSPTFDNTYAATTNMLMYAVDDVNFHMTGFDGLGVCSIGSDGAIDPITFDNSQSESPTYSGDPIFFTYGNVKSNNMSNAMPPVAGSRFIHFDAKDIDTNTWMGGPGVLVLPIASLSSLSSPLEYQMARFPRRRR
jgi:hypothetical protein